MASLWDSCNSAPISPSSYKEVCLVSDASLQSLGKQANHDDTMTNVRNAVSAPISPTSTCRIPQKYLAQARDVLPTHRQATTLVAQIMATVGTEMKVVKGTVSLTHRTINTD